MLSGEKLQTARKAVGMSVGDLASKMERSGVTESQAKTAIKNWERGLLKPAPSRTDEETLARSLGVERQDLVVWVARHHYAPMAPRKVRLVTDMIRGLDAQHALDVLEFANKRAAVMVRKVLESAIANADEQEADVTKLFVSDAHADEAGIRQGTRRWRPKDRGAAVSWTRLASHIVVAVDMA